MFNCSTTNEEDLCSHKRPHELLEAGDDGDEGDNGAPQPNIQENDVPFFLSLPEGEVFNSKDEQDQYKDGDYVPLPKPKKVGSKEKIHSKFNTWQDSSTPPDLTPQARQAIIILS
ncbi:hypothetical protein C0995_012152 [Termitomyces sp. Mi166|nr:hypothetical protein C0995_012152 [Termitomyces sp. Mi166\